MSCSHEAGLVTDVPGAESPRAVILLVEDEGFVREVTGAVLESAGYRVLKAANAAEARFVFHSEKEVQLLLTDVVMPGQNGYELAKGLQHIRPELKTLFTSGYITTKKANSRVMKSA
jgi:DNA-binding NtrC family response regulator